MKKILNLLLHPLALLLPLLLAVAAAVWWIGPQISIGLWKPLDGLVERLGLIGLLVLAWTAAALVVLRRRRRAASPAREAAAQAPADLGYKRALAVLSDSASQSGRHRWWHGDRFLYDRPWYLVLGAPASGKSSVLRHAGLSFAFGTQSGPRAARSARRSCDWAIADEAVLIDTTGDFSLAAAASDDTAHTPDAWQQLMGLLKRVRPRQPLNGVLLVLSMAQLLLQSAGERREYAATLRARLHALQAQLGVRPPVYVLVTKADLLAGFQESFEALRREEREQVWGFSFPHERPGEDHPVQAFAGEFAALEKRLRERLRDLLQTRSDPAQRATIFAFPQQFAGIRGVLGSFLEGVFASGGELEENAMLRGVFFGSALQDGTPIDRVRDTLTRTFGLDGSAPPAPPAGGRTYFLARLLREVLIAERGLVGESRRVQARGRRRRLAGKCLLALAAAALVAGWSVSYLRNRAYLARVEARLPAVLAAVGTVPEADGTDLSLLPEVLDLVRDAPEPSAFSVDHPPRLSGLGLWQGRYLRAGSDIGYRRLLDEALLPRVARRLQERLRAAGSEDLELAYDALKHYLMLYEPQHLDAVGLREWVDRDWAENLQDALPPARLASLSGHFAEALARDDRQALPSMDEELVARVREMLASYPLEYRAFSRMRANRAAAGTTGTAGSTGSTGTTDPTGTTGAAEFSAVSAAGPGAAEVFERASRQPISRGIPGMFTRDGYLRDFRNAVFPVVRQLGEETRWVLGTGAGGGRGGGAPGGGGAPATTDAETVRVVERVRHLYLTEYIRLWDAYLADVRLTRLDALGSSLDVARTLAAADSPLPAYLRVVIRETSLGAAVQAEAPAGRPPEAVVDAHFARLHHLAEGRPPPLDEVMRLFTEAYLQLNNISSAQNSHSAPAEPGPAIAAAAALQPEPVRSMLQALADSGNRHGRQAERLELSAVLRPVAEFCVRAVAGRYPFASGATTDVLLGDFGQFFGVGGLLDDFFQHNLAGSVDAGVTPWRYKPLPDGSRPEGGAGLADFQRAARIRDAFFRQAGQNAGFSVDLRLLETDASSKELTLEVDGQVLHAGGPGSVAHTVAWPGPRNASHIRLAAAGGGQGGGSSLNFDGPWALFRLLQRFEVRPSPQPERLVVLLGLGGRQARLEVVSASALNPLRLRELERFRCPDQL